MGLFGSKYEWAGKNVVITGGSRGLGQALAVALAEQGAHITIVARNETLLQTVCEELRAKRQTSTQRITYASADLSNVQEANRVIQNLEHTPDCVLLVAGGSHPVLCADADPNVFSEQMNVNYYSACYPAQAAIKRMISSPPPTSRPLIMFTSSVATFVSLTGYGPYVASKAAVRALADTLRQECKMYGIDVRCCFPAGIISPGFEQENLIKPDITKTLEGSDVPLPPEIVAAHVLQGIERGNYMISYGFENNLLRCLSRGANPMNSVLDIAFALVAAVVWPIVRATFDSKVVAYGKRRNQEHQR